MALGSIRPAGRWLKHAGETGPPATDEFQFVVPARLGQPAGCPSSWKYGSRTTALFTPLLTVGSVMTPTSLGAVPELVVLQSAVNPVMVSIAPQGTARVVAGSRTVPC